MVISFYPPDVPAALPFRAFWRCCRHGVYRPYILYLPYVRHSYGRYLPACGWVYQQEMVCLLNLLALSCWDNKAGQEFV